MEMVPCGPDGNGFAVSCNKAWLVKAAPYIKIGLILLKEVLATYHLPLPIAHALNLLENNVDLHSKYIDGALNFVTSACSASIGQAINKEVTVCLDATDRITELRSLDLSPGAAKEAYAKVKEVLTAHGYWSK
jgi:hypothetical protein